MAVQRVRAGVELAVGKPTEKRWIGVVEHLLRLADPGHCLRSPPPERRRIVDAGVEKMPIAAHFTSSRRRLVRRIVRGVLHFVVLVLNHRRRRSLVGPLGMYPTGKEIDGVVRPWPWAI